MLTRCLLHFWLVVLPAGAAWRRSPEGGGPDQPQAAAAAAAEARWGLALAHQERHGGACQVRGAAGAPGRVLAAAGTADGQVGDQGRALCKMVDDQCVQLCEQRVNFSLQQALGVGCSGLGDCRAGTL